MCVCVTATVLCVRLFAIVQGKPLAYECEHVSNMCCRRGAEGQQLHTHTHTRTRISHITSACRARNWDASTVVVVVVIEQSITRELRATGRQLATTRSHLSESKLHATCACAPSVCARLYYERTHTHTHTGPQCGHAFGRYGGDGSGADALALGVGDLN